MTDHRHKRLWKRVLRDHPELITWLKEDSTDERGRALAAMVASYRDHHGHGPSWAALGLQARPQLSGYPPVVRRWFADRLVRTLAKGGWLIYGEKKPGSLRPGPRLTL
jgi:hypothetical protein